jgi:hypothetical protein
VTVKHGEGARRMYHNIHNSPSQGGAKRASMRVAPRWKDLVVDRPSATGPLPR